MSKSWADESDFSEEDEEDISQESNNEDEEEIDDEEEEEEDDDEEEDDEEEEEEEIIEDIEEAEDNEDEINDDEENEEFDEDDGILLVEEEPVKVKRKREYILNKKEIEKQEKEFLYNNFTDEDFINNIKEYLQQITTQKNSEILLKNILESSKTGTNINVVSRKEILEKVNYLVYFYTTLNEGDTLGSPLKTIKEIQTDIKNNNIGFYSYSNNNFWDQYREIIKKEVNKIKQPVEVVDGLYSCSKCKGTVTQSYSIQTRRSDEPPTVFIHCMNKQCMHKWREG